MNGFEAISKLKSDSRFNLIPIIIVSAKISTHDKVIGLDIGADDYISKPFESVELISRIKANYRQYKKITKVNNQKDDISHKNIELFEECHKIIAYGKTLELTRTTYEIFSLLIKREGELVTRDEICNVVWDEDYIDGSRAIDMHLSSIRKELKKLTNEKHIITRRGYGYKFTQQ